MRNPFNYFRRGTAKDKDFPSGNKLCLCFHAVPAAECRQLRKISVMLVLIFIVAYAAFSQCPSGPEGKPGVDGIGPALQVRSEKPVAYRIRTEEAITVPAGVTLTEDERKAVARLNSLMERWPRKLWLFSNNGHLMLAKMGDDGKPMGAGK